MVSGKLLQCLTDTNIKIKGAVRKVGCKYCHFMSMSLQQLLQIEHIDAITAPAVIEFVG